jgi:hypothetical protein
VGLEGGLLPSAGTKKLAPSDAELQMENYPASPAIDEASYGNHGTLNKSYIQSHYMLQYVKKRVK